MHSVARLSVLALALTALPAIQAKPKYAKEIPNGSGVAGVTAVGHTDPDAGGALNAFGKAFAAASNAWTEALCKADSDGDGQTNGEELGDPCCTWKVGATPAVAAGAKDPGSATSKLDDAALTAARALCKAADPGTVKPAEGASNATPALTPGAPASTAPGAAPAAPGAVPSVAPGAAPGAAPAAATAGSDGFDWVPIEQVNNKTNSGASTVTAPSTPSTATNSSKNGTNSSSAALPSTLSARGTLAQVMAATVVGAIALAL